jgi:hypothetical protein
MDWVRIHAVLNEVPAAGIGLGLLCLIITFAAGGNGLRKLAFELFALGSVFGILAFLSGSPTEALLASAPGMSKSLVEQHQIAARVAAFVTGLLGLIAFHGVLSLSRGRALSRMFTGLVLFVSLSAIASTGWAVYTGSRVHGAQVGAQYLPHNKPDKDNKPPGEKERPKKPANRIAS